METMRCHKTKIDLFLRTIFLHSSGPIQQNYIHKHMSVGVITPWDTSLSNDFLPDVLLIFLDLTTRSQTVSLMI